MKALTRELPGFTQPSQKCNQRAGVGMIGMTLKIDEAAN